MVVLSLTKRGQELLERAETRTGDALATVASFDSHREHELLIGIDYCENALDCGAADLHDTLKSGSITTTV
jgi:hypothetical protein